MIEIITAAVLGIVEGVTEFLPVSSTGHLIILNQWLSFSPDFTKVFDVVIQLGAILAVVIIFRKRLFSWALWKKVGVAVVPALVAGALLGSIVQDRLFNPLTVAIALIVGGILLVFAERLAPAPRISSEAEVGYGKALVIGLIQCLALIPGTSRSAATILGARFLGASRAFAAEFSFMLAIPTMLAASAYSLLKGGAVIGGREAGLLAVGFVVSFVVALAVVKGFMRYIETRSFAAFGWYRIALGIAVLALLTVR